MHIWHTCQERQTAAIQNKINDVNNILTRVCGLNKWTYIDNSNKDHTCLNRRKLHLNKKGSSKALLHAAIFYATCLATQRKAKIKQNILALHSKTCYTLQRVHTI